MIEADRQSIDYRYCLNEDTCIHRRGCARWIGNYKDEVAIAISDSTTHYIDDLDCMNAQPWGFVFMDRFRLSDGSKIKIKDEQ